MCAACVACGKGAAGGVRWSGKGPFRVGCVDEKEGDGVASRRMIKMMKMSVVMSVAMAVASLRDVPGLVSEHFCIHLHLIRYRTIKRIKSNQIKQV